MNLFKIPGFFGKGAGAIVFAAFLAFGTAAAQDSTVTTIAHGQPSFDTQVKNARLSMWKATIWCSNWRAAGSSTSLFLTATDSPSTAKQVSVHELVPEMKLTQTITTATTPRYVNSVRTIEGKVGMRMLQSH